jgi:hypothetical protein
MKMTLMLAGVATLLVGCCCSKHNTGGTGGTPPTYYSTAPAAPAAPAGGTGATVYVTTQPATPATTQSWVLEPGQKLTIMPAP